MNPMPPGPPGFFNDEPSVKARKRLFDMRPIQPEATPCAADNSQRLVVAYAYSGNRWKPAGLIVPSPVLRPISSRIQGDAMDPEDRAQSSRLAPGHTALSSSLLEHDGNRGALVMAHHFNWN